MDSMRKAVEERKKSEAERLNRKRAGSGNGGTSVGGSDKKSGRRATGQRSSGGNGGSSGGGSGRDSGRGNGNITSAFIRECLRTNELGDGMLYSALHEGQFIFNKSAGEWLTWGGHHWDRDIMDYSLAAVEDVAQYYIDEQDNTKEEKNQASKNKNEQAISIAEKIEHALVKRATRLRSDRGRMNCRKFAHTNTVNALAIQGEELDINPWLLACKNGVLDLRTGEMRAGRPDDYISKASPIEWRGLDEPAPTWENTLREIFSEDEDLVSYIARLFGYGITGLTTQHIMPILWGQGRNGKGTLILVFSYVLGPLAGPIQAEMLLNQGQSRNPSGPSPDIMRLRGLRLAFASEADEGRRFSPSRVKWLSGGDPLVARSPHDRYETEFIPTHTLILLTNHKPHVSADDYAFWERVHMIPFKLSFVDRDPAADNERRADQDLLEKLKFEASGILAWLVRGCLQWQKLGLAPPPIIKEATAEYRRDEDLLADFLDECCHIDPKTEVPASQLYHAFSQWFEENVSKKVLSQRKFGIMMGKRFEKEKVGTYTYIGLRLLAGL